MSNCKSCGAEIRWVRTPAGKMMPLDAKPTPEGNVVVVRGIGYAGTSKYTGDPNLLPGEEFRYTSHFATCPQAGQHRR